MNMNKVAKDQHDNIEKEIEDSSHYFILNLNYHFTQKNISMKLKN